MQDCASHAKSCFVAVQLAVEGGNLSAREVALCVACKQAAVAASVAGASSWDCGEAAADEMQALLPEGGIDALIGELISGAGGSTELGATDGAAAGGSNGMESQGAAKSAARHRGQSNASAAAAEPAKPKAAGRPPAAAPAAMKPAT